MHFSDEEIVERARWLQVSRGRDEVAHVLARHVHPVVDQATLVPIINKMMERFEPTEVEVPSWVKTICNHRDSFGCAAVGWLVGEEEWPKEIFLLTLVQCSPQGVTLLRASLELTEWPCFEAMQVGEQPDVDLFLTNYRTSGCVYVDVRDVAVPGDGRLVVLPHVSHAPGRVQVVTAPLRWLNFCCTPPRKERASDRPSQTGGSKKVSEGVYARLLEEFPWLTPEDVQMAARRKV